jgi:hypothetical protein
MLSLEGEVFEWDLLHASKNCGHNSEKSSYWVFSDQLSFSGR